MTGNYSNYSHTCLQLVIFHFLFTFLFLFSHNFFFMGPMENEHYYYYFLFKCIYLIDRTPQSKLTMELVAKTITFYENLAHKMIILPSL